MKPQTWFRLYNEVVDDPKVQQLPPALFRAWINFLCLVSKNGFCLPSIADIAYRLRVSKGKAESLRGELVAAGLFEEEDGGFYPHNWNGRQFKSDVSTDRVRAFRERSGNVSETAEETPAPEQSRTEQKQNREKPTRADARRVPFRDFMFTELRRVGVEPVPDAADWKQYESFLLKTDGKPAFTLEKLCEYFTRFVDSPDGFTRRQGHPIRYFCTNVSGFMRDEKPKAQRPRSVVL